MATFNSSSFIGQAREAGIQSAMVDASRPLALNAVKGAGVTTIAVFMGASLLGIPGMLGAAAIMGANGALRERNAFSAGQRIGIPSAPVAEASAL